MAVSGGDVHVFDDVLYSRQRYVLGDGAMGQLTGSSVFLFGLGPLGVEIAKNLILTGVRKLTIYDPKTVSESDVLFNFFLDNKSVGKNRAVASQHELKKLNSYVEVDVLEQPFEYNNDYSILRNYQCVVLTEVLLRIQLHINDFCRCQIPPIKFVCGDTFGVLCWSFCDFGEEHHILDADGEETQQAFIAHITKTFPITVTVVEYETHGLVAGDIVTFNEIMGMTHLNGTAHKVTDSTLSSFQIEPVEGHGLAEYTGGGICRKVKSLITVPFESLQRQLQKPKLFGAEDMAVAATCHLTFLTLHAFCEKHDRKPRPWCAEDYSEFADMSRTIRAEIAIDFRVDETVLSIIAKTLSGIVPPLSAFLGGVIAQEALKAVTGTFTPLQQVFSYFAGNVIPEQIDDVPALISETTQDPIAVCIGSFAQRVLQELNVFMVGCGAIGCEMLKNMALLNVGSSGGQITITDPDLVEKSNLSRQFLFRDDCVHEPKSTAAAKAIHRLKPDVNIEAYDLKVDQNSEEELFNDAFFGLQNVIISALDNVEGRRYLDRRCIQTSRAMLDSGTLGTKGHIQVILPFLTEAYTSQSDPVEDDIPYCTLKSFPTRIEHTIEWAKEKFESLFFRKPDIFKRFAVARLEVQTVVERVNQGLELDKSHQEILEKMGCALKVYLSERPKDWRESLHWARVKFEKYYNHKAKQLLFKFPLEAKSDTGGLFWHSPRRPPTPLQFDINDSTHLRFVISTARLLCSIWNIPVTQDDLSMSNVSHILSTAEVPEFVPNVHKYVETDASVVPPKRQKTPCKPENGPDVHGLMHLLDQIDFDAVTPQTFNKDDVKYGHMDFVTSASNLRATMYSLEPVETHVVRRIAGRIAPAIITTTSAVAGLLSLELIKLAQRRPIEKHQNCFLNLALPTFIFSEPARAPVVTLNKNTSFTLWDKWEVYGHESFTLHDFMECVKEKYGGIITMVLQGTKIIYMPFLPGHMEKHKQPMARLISPEAGACAVLTICVEAENHDEKYGPPVKYYFNF